MADVEAIKKQLKIRTGAVQRLLKEKKLYTEEVVKLKEGLEELKTKEGVEAWDIKNKTRLVEESEKMVTDTTTRLEKAVGSLEEIIEGAKGQDGVAEGLEKAEQVFAEAKV